MTLAFAALVRPPGRPESRSVFRSREAALRCAKRAVERDGGTADVVWLKDGVPKLWLALVSEGGISLTEHWV